MSILLKLEQLAIFLLSIFLFSTIESNLLLFALFWITPDIGMIGYLINTKIGSITYNLTHHQFIAIIVIILGFHLDSYELSFIGTILLGHASLDRVLGYGLKYSDNFKHTHLTN